MKIVIIALLIIGIFYLSKYWIKTFNIFQELKTHCDKLMGNVNSIKQQRLDNIYALAESVKRYNLHEYNTLLEIIKTRGDLQKFPELKSILPSINALVEQYPNLKSNEMFNRLMGKDSLIENSLKEERFLLNKALREYNQFVRQFPSNMVAIVHQFKELDYTKFVQEEYAPKEIFGTDN